MNEAETRAEHIDPALKAAGWGVVEGSRIRREYPITSGRLEGNGKKGKALTADYVLEYRNPTPHEPLRAEAGGAEEGVAALGLCRGALILRLLPFTGIITLYSLKQLPPYVSQCPSLGKA
jgi:hypothetical protein